MGIGDIVRVRIDLYGAPTRGRLAVITDIDRLSQTGAYPDRYSIAMLLGDQEYDTVAGALTLHRPATPPLAAAKGEIE